MNEGVCVWWKPRKRRVEENQSGTCCLSLVWVGCILDISEGTCPEFGGSMELSEVNEFPVQCSCPTVRVLHMHLIFQESGIVRKWRKLLI